MNTLNSWIDEHTEMILDTYKHLHSIPELALQEVKTSAYLAEELKKIGFSVIDKIGGTGVVGTLKGAEPGLTFALRADIDALPIEEKTGLPFASTHPGVMHACGHDSHAAMVLNTARAIVATGGIKRGTLKIVFQPAEEILEGARLIMNSGAIDDVDEIVGIHNRIKAEAPSGQASPGVCHGGARRVLATVHGKAAHGAWLHMGINAIDAAAAIVGAVNAIRVDPRVNHSVKTTRCIAGSTATNVIPDTAEMAFDLRAQTNEILEDLHQKTIRAIEAGAASVGATATIVNAGGCPAAALDPELVAATRESIEAVCGSSLPLMITPASEDFHCYSVEGGIKSAFVGVGADTNTGHHTPTMMLDLKALPVGVKILADLTAKKLR